MGNSALAIGRGSCGTFLAYRFLPSSAFPTCCCPLPLSVPGRLDDPRTFPSCSSSLRERYVSALNGAHGHTIHGFWCGAWRHRSFIGVNACVGSDVQVWIEELSIQILYRRPSFASVVKHTKNSCGWSHLSCSSLCSGMNSFCAPSPCT